VGVKLDVEFVSPFIEGTVETLKVQCEYPLKQGKPFLKGEGKEIDTVIASVIGLTSTKFNGSIAVCYPKEVFLKIMSNMLGEEYKEINEDLEDGAGELLNIIFGYAKKLLNEKGFDIQKAIPTIVTGDNLNVKHVSPNPTLVLPFESEMGPVHVEISIDSG